MTRRIGIIGTAALLGIALLAACGGAQAVKTGATPPPPATKSFDEAEWIITTPDGWIREDTTTTADAKKAIRYRGPAGEYVIVAIDPLGSDFAYDALWRYAVKANGFEVVERYQCAGKADESCSDSDARYDGYVLWKSGTNPVKVGGHTWYFQFGNSAKATVDAAMFEQIVESIQVKA